MLSDESIEQHLNPYATVDADWLSSIWDVAGTFWANPDMSVDEAVETLQSDYDAILGL